MLVISDAEPSYGIIGKARGLFLFCFSSSPPSPVVPCPDLCVSSEMFMCFCPKSGLNEAGTLKEQSGSGAPAFRSSLQDQTKSQTLTSVFSSEELLEGTGIMF